MAHHKVIALVMASLLMFAFAGRLANLRANQDHGVNEAQKLSVVEKIIDSLLAMFSTTQATEKANATDGLDGADPAWRDWRCDIVYEDNEAECKKLLPGCTWLPTSQPEEKNEEPPVSKGWLSSVYSLVAPQQQVKTPGKCYSEARLKEAEAKAAPVRARAEAEVSRAAEAKRAKPTEANHCVQLENVAVCPEATKPLDINECKDYGKDSGGPPSVTKGAWHGLPRGCTQEIVSKAVMYNSFGSTTKDQLVIESKPASGIRSGFALICQEATAEKAEEKSEKAAVAEAQTATGRATGKAADTNAPAKGALASKAPPAALRRAVRVKRPPMSLRGDSNGRSSAESRKKALDEHRLRSMNGSKVALKKAAADKVEKAAENYAYAVSKGVMTNQDVMRSKLAAADARAADDAEAEIWRRLPDGVKDLVDAVRAARKAMGKANEQNAYKEFPNNQIWTPPSPKGVTDAESLAADLAHASLACMAAGGTTREILPVDVSDVLIEQEGKANSEQCFGSMTDFMKKIDDRAKTFKTALHDQCVWAVVTKEVAPLALQAGDCSLISSMMI